MPVHNCNWLQIHENTADSVHTYYLHGMMNKVHTSDARGLEEYFKPIEDYRWGICRWGITKEIVYGDDLPLETRPPLIFPNVLRIPQGPIDAIHFRIPIDDEHTRIIWLGFIAESAGGKRSDTNEVVPFTYLVDDPAVDRYDLTTVYGQDRMAFETPGVIFDRTRETLGATDRGIVMYRQMLEEQITRVERGLAPDVAVVAPEESEDIISFEATRFEGSLEMSLMSPSR